MKIEPSSPMVTHVARVGRGAIAAVAVLVCAALMSACGSSSSSGSTTPAKIDLNTAHVAGAIEQSILTERHIHAKVSCPAVVPQQRGRTFRCIATTRATKPPFAERKTPFVVTVQNTKGYVTYKGE